MSAIITNTSLEKSKNDIHKNNSNTEFEKNKGSLEGKIYEKLVVALLARIGYELSNNENNEYYDFSIGREVKLSEDNKFDDAVFAYNHNNSKPHLICTQIKYKQGDCSIDSDSLSNPTSTSKNKEDHMNRDFNLKKYFTSYLTARKELESTKSKELKNKELKYVVIFTNCSLNRDDLKSNGFSLKEGPTGIISLFNLKKSSSKAGNLKESSSKAEDLNHWQLGKVNPTTCKSFEKSSDLHRIAEEFANYICWAETYGEKIMGTNQTFIKRYHVGLRKEVINIKKTINENGKQYCIGKFNDSFVDNNELGPKQELRDAILEFIKEKDTSKKKCTNDILKSFLKNAEWKLEKSFGESKDIGKMLPKQWKLVEKEDISDFLSSLVFIVNQPDIKHFSSINEELTQNSILENSTLCHLLDCMKNSISSEFIDRLETALGISKKITYKEKWISGKEIINFVEEQINQVFTALIIASVTSIYKKKVTQYGRFKNLEGLFEDLDDFLNSNNLIFCLYISNTRLGSIKLFQYFQTKCSEKLGAGNLFISLNCLQNKENRNAIMKAFEKENNNLLIIECNHRNKQIVQELYEKLMKILKIKPKKKIIIITNQDENTLAEYFKNAFQNEGQYIQKENEINLAKFKPYKDDPFQKQITFMGQEKLTLAKLTDISNWHYYFNDHLKNYNQEISNIMSKALTEILISENEIIQIGRKPLGTSDLEGAYIELVEEINLKTLIDKLCEKLNNIYVISEINENDTRKTLEKFFKHLEYIDEQSVNDIKNQLVKNSNVIQIKDNCFQIENFKELCRQNSEKMIYFIILETENNQSKYVLHRFYNPNFYTKRYFKEIIIQKHIQKLLVSENYSNTIFIFSGIANKSKFKKLFTFDNPNEEEKFSNVLENENIKLIEGSAKQIFNCLSKQNPDKTIHLLKVLENQLIWINSQGSVGNIQDYIDKEQSKKILFDENEFVERIIDKKVVIFSDEPGMGKSTTMTRLIEMQYQSGSGTMSIFESHSVIQINLRSHLHWAEKIECNNIDIIKILSEIDVNLNSDLAKCLLKLALEENFYKPLLLAFDGFDEIQDERNRNKVIALLIFLKNKTKCKLWITTRPHYERMLENTLNTFSTRFFPLNDEIMFTNKFFEDRLNLVLSTEKFREVFDETRSNAKVQKYSEAFIKKVQSIFSGDESKFIGTPLQLHLLLENSLTHFKNWVESSDDQNLNFDYLGDNLLDIYKNFIDKKYEIYFKKIGAQSELQQKKDKMICDQCHIALAKSLLFESQPKQILNNFKDIVLSLGIITSRNQNFEFIHSTFAEYFTVELCSHWIEKIQHNLSNKQKFQFLLNDVLIEPYYYQIRTFLNFKLKGILKTKKLPRENLKKFGEIITNQGNPASYELGSTIYYNAVLSENEHIIKFFFHCLDEINISQQYLFNILTDMSSLFRTALHYIVLKNNDNITKLILNEMCDKLSKKQIYNILSMRENGKGMFFNGSIGISINEKHANDFGLISEDEKLIAKQIIYNASLNMNDENWESVLFDEIKKQFPNTIENGKTVLHYSTKNNNYEITQYILRIAIENFSVDELKNFLRLQDMMGNTILHYSSMCKNENMVELILNTAQNVLSEKEFLAFLDIKNRDNKTAH